MDCLTFKAHSYRDSVDGDSALVVDFASMVAVLLPEVVVEVAVAVVVVAAETNGDFPSFPEGSVLCTSLTVRPNIPGEVADSRTDRDFVYCCCCCRGCRARSLLFRFASVVVVMVVGTTAYEDDDDDNARFSLSRIDRLGAATGAAGAGGGSADTRGEHRIGTGTDGDSNTGGDAGGGTGGDAGGDC